MRASCSARLTPSWACVSVDTRTYPRARLGASGEGLWRGCCLAIGRFWDAIGRDWTLFFWSSPTKSPVSASKMAVPRTVGLIGRFFDYYRNARASCVAHAIVAKKASNESHYSKPSKMAGVVRVVAGQAPKKASQKASNALVLAKNEGIRPPFRPPFRAFFGASRPPGAARPRRSPWRSFSLG